jgi:uncharacterized membrane protein
MVLVPKRDVTVLDMSVEEAAKMIISAGLVAPERRKAGEVVPAAGEDLSEAAE